MMQVLLNDTELVEAVARRMIMIGMRRMLPTFVNTDAYAHKCQKQWHKARQLNLDFNTLRELILKDLQAWRDEINSRFKQYYRPAIKWLAEDLDRIDANRDLSLSLTKVDQHQTFIQKIAQTLDSNICLITKNFNIRTDQDIIIRNVLNNEQLLQQLMRSNHNFWFIDSGYTNFVTDKKTWHRLVRNHVHVGLEGQRYFPTDRLKLLPSMPEPWREPGRDILVVLSSESHYSMWGTTAEAWQQHITDGLRDHTSRRIVFKPKKDTRKTRRTVYDQLQKEPDRWYCVISDSSAAAVEAIWSGVPVITLTQHITNPVSRNQLDMINDLYRGPIGDWLCALSYSQFTAQEMVDGTARMIMERYHGV